MKLHVEEPGTAKVQRLFRRRRRVSSVILPLETLAVFSRRRSEGSLSPTDFEALVTRFRTDSPLFDWVALTEQVREASERILPERWLRTLDAMHVGAALSLPEELSLEALEFVTGDRKQRCGARGLGMDVVFVGDDG